MVNSVNAQFFAGGGLSTKDCMQCQRGRICQGCQTEQNIHRTPLIPGSSSEGLFQFNKFILLTY